MSAGLLIDWDGCGDFIEVFKLSDGQYTTSRIVTQDELEEIKTIYEKLAPASLERYYNAKPRER